MISEVFVYTVYIDIESILIQEMGQYHILIYGYLYAGFGGGLGSLRDGLLSCHTGVSGYP